jgi:hypothetical protein
MTRRRVRRFEPHIAQGSGFGGELLAGCESILKVLEAGKRALAAP